MTLTQVREDVGDSKTAWQDGSLETAHKYIIACLISIAAPTEVAAILFAP
ncbi:hypothetical protein [Roseiconus lacunae]|nr:hypothetical protein [Roseiconus lacunae]